MVNKLKRSNNRVAKFTVLFMVLATVFGVFAWSWWKDKQPILQPTVNHKVYASVQEAVDSVVKEQPDYEKLKGDYLVVFYKNGCKYCIGGIGGVLERYQMLSDKAKEQVVFFEVTTDQGKQLAKQYGLTKPSRMVYVPATTKETVYRYSTDNLNANRPLINDVFSRLEGSIK